MKIRNVALQAKSLSSKKFKYRKEFLKTKENNLENLRELNKNAQTKKEKDFRVHSYTQLTMSYYSQLGKTKFHCSRWNT